MIPTEEEHAVRQQVINRITNVINQYLPTASVKSYKTSWAKKQRATFAVFLSSRLISTAVIKPACIYPWGERREIDVTRFSYWFFPV